MRLLTGKSSARNAKSRRVSRGPLHFVLSGDLRLTLRATRTIGVLPSKGPLVSWMRSCSAPLASISTGSGARLAISSADNFGGLRGRLNMVSSVCSIGSEVWHLTPSRQSA